MSLLNRPFILTNVALLRTSGCLSLIGSSVILYAIVSDRKKKIQRIQYRLLAGVCVTDVLYSLANIVSTAAIPRDTPDIYHLYGNIGTTATCQAQGFLFQWGAVGVPFYMAALSLYYLLVIRYKMKDQDIARKVEPYMHAISILIPLAFAIAALCLDLYHNKLFFCWIETLPWGCSTMKGIDCTRAKNARMYQVWFATAWVLAVTIIQIVAMGVIYFTVRHQEQSINRYSFQSSRNGEILSQTSTKVASEARDTAIQACLYIFSFLITYIWPVAGYIMFRTSTRPKPIFYFLSSFFVPLLGFWNFVAYMRPRYVKISRDNYGKSFFWKLKASILTSKVDERQLRQRGYPTHRLPRRATIARTENIQHDYGLPPTKMPRSSSFNVRATSLGHVNRQLSDSDVTDIPKIANVSMGPSELIQYFSSTSKMSDPLESSESIALSNDSKEGNYGFDDTLNEDHFEFHLTVAEEEHINDDSDVVYPDQLDCGRPERRLSLVKVLLSDFPEDDVST